MRFIVTFFNVVCVLVNDYLLSQPVVLAWSCIDKFFCASSDSGLVFLGFSEITECEKAGHACPPGKVCKSQKDSGYGCACKDGYEEILLEKGNSTCRGSKTMSR